MPTTEELEAMARATFGLHWGNLTPDNRAKVMQLALSLKRNDVLCDIVTTLDRIQNDTDAISKVMWDR